MVLDYTLDKYSKQELSKGAVGSCLGLVILVISVQRGVVVSPGRRHTCHRHSGNGCTLK